MENNKYRVSPRTAADTIRFRVTLVAVTDGVFAIGGFDEDYTDLSTVSYYDIKKNIWIVGYPKMHIARFNASACFFKATVYVFCGG